MSHMETHAEMPWENNSQSLIPWDQRVADRVHLQLAFLPVWDSNPQDAEENYWCFTDWATQEGLKKSSEKPQYSQKMHEMICFTLSLMDDLSLLRNTKTASDSQIFHIVRLFFTINWTQI